MSIEEIKKYESFVNDKYLNYLYEEKSKIISHSLPTIKYNLTSGKLTYNLDNPLLRKIDIMIEERIDYLKHKLYESSSERQIWL
jgi:hypothetical protein